MLKHIIAFAALSGAVPAMAVTVTGITTSGSSTVNVVTAEPGLLAADIALNDFAPITLDLAAGEGEAGFDFNSVVDVFTGVELGQLVGTLSLTLTGATFETVGSIAPAFSFAKWSLNDSADTLIIAFNPDGEGYGVSLGNIDGFGSNFVIAFAGSESARGATSLTIAAAAVPEPATWAMFILGFGAIGTAMRRRRLAL